MFGESNFRRVKILEGSKFGGRLTNIEGQNFGGSKFLGGQNIWGFKIF